MTKIVSLPTDAEQTLALTRLVMARKSSKQMPVSRKSKGIAIRYTRGTYWALSPSNGPTEVTMEIIEGSRSTDVSITARLRNYAIVVDLAVTVAALVVFMIFPFMTIFPICTGPPILLVILMWIMNALCGPSTESTVARDLARKFEALRTAEVPVTTAQVNPAIGEAGWLTPPIGLTLDIVDRVTRRSYTLEVSEDSDVNEVANALSRHMGESIELSFRGGVLRRDLKVRDIPHAFRRLGLKVWRPDKEPGDSATERSA